MRSEADSRAKAFSQKVDHQLGYNGTFNPEDTDSIIDEFKTSGADKIVEEVQRQLNEWRVKVVN